MRGRGGRGLDVRREMDVEPRLRQQPLRLNGGDELLARSMVERLRRHPFLQFDVNGYGMALFGADEGLVGVEGVALLRVFRDDALQRRHVEQMRPADARDQRGHARPSVFVKRDADHLLSG